MKPNFDNSERKPAFNTPAAPGLTGQAPLPVGRPMRLKRVSPGERAVLEKYGWKDGDPVPTNLADVIEQAEADASDLDNMPPPVDMKTPALKLPKEVDLSKMPAAEQEKYAQVLASLTNAKLQKVVEDELQDSYVPDGAGVNASAINDAIRAAAQPSNLIKDDTKEAEYASGAKKEIPEEPVQTSGNKYCAHCGWNKDIPDGIEVTEADRIGFLQTMLGLQPFTKTIRLYGGRLNITVQSLTPDEVDMCFRQVFLDRQNGRTQNHAEEAEALARYKACLQVIEIVGPNLHYVRPTNLPVQDKGETEVFTRWRQFTLELDKSETLHRNLLGAVGRFNAILGKLEDNADNENFWPAIG